MAVINPPAFLQNRTDHSAQIDRLSRTGFYLPSSVGALGSPGGVRVPGDCKVTQQATSNKTVKVAAGIVDVPGTINASQGVYRVVNDASLTLVIADNSLGTTRYDLIVARVYDSFYAGSTDSATIEVIQGTGPSDPAIPANTYVLARVAAPNAFTSITDAMITNLSEMTYVAGGIKPVSLADSIPGIYIGQYRDHPTLGLQRWDGTNWVQVDTNTDLGKQTIGGRTYSNANGYFTVALTPVFTQTPNFVACVDYNNGALTCTTEGVTTQYATVRTWLNGASFANVPCQWIATGTYA